MRRRDLIAGLGSFATVVAAAARLSAALAQPRVIPTVCVLQEGPPDEGEAVYVDASLRQGLMETGFVEGRNVAVARHFGQGLLDRLPALAADLVLRRCEVIAALETNTTLAAEAATRTIPIVFSIGGDPVALGLVASFNHPDGNVTGVANLATEISTKRLELLRKVVPGADLIAMLVGSKDLPVDRGEISVVQAAAGALGVRSLFLVANSESEVAAAFRTLVERRAGALLVGTAVTLADARDQIISLAARHSIPTMFYYTSSVGAGGLISYGPDTFEAYRQVGIYVGRILNGEKPANLPVQRPTRFKLMINLKTANALGLTIPPTLLATADEVIE
jgi:putative tryptophan/tyrosine transport system substrate-binding protein